MKEIIIDGVTYTLTPKEEKKSLIVKEEYHFELHPEKATNKMTWEEAVKYCKELGDGWRLPTIEECFMIHNNKLITEDCYWSSTENDSSYAWGFSFGSGGAFSSSKSNTYYVRAVKTIK